MLGKLKRILGLSHPGAARPTEDNSIAHGPRGIEQVGHRRYVGGMWDQLGHLQFDFLVGQGLQPSHYLLDIACGSLRAGIHFIPYLDRGHYMGVDKEQALIDAGIRVELPADLYQAKAPVLLVSASFEFEKLPHAPDYALAQSLFTHLPPELVTTCLRKLRPCVTRGSLFFATFLTSSQARPNRADAHDHDVFFYTQSQMRNFGTETGWDMTYIGEWGHPRGQVMVKYAPR